jgi:hypothetical protein
MNGCAGSYSGDRRVSDDRIRDAADGRHEPKNAMTAADAWRGARRRLAPGR